MRATLAFLAFVIAGASVQAQVALGVRVGYAGAWLTQTDASLQVNGARPGLTAGVFAEVPLGPGFSVRPEVAFVQKGNRTASVRAGYDLLRGR